MSNQTKRPCADPVRVDKDQGGWVVIRHALATQADSDALGWFAEFAQAAAFCAFCREAARDEWQAELA